MTGSEIRKETADYLTTQLEERKNAGITKVPMFDERDVLQAYSDGLLNGLRHHSHDYLVKTEDLKKSYEKQKEINKELVDENEKLKKGVSGATMLYKHLSRAKEIIKELLDFDFLPDIKIKKEAEEFLKAPEAEA